MTLNLIKTFKTSIYNTEHTKKINFYFREIQLFQKSIFPEISSSLKSAFFADFHGPPLAGLKF